MRVVLFDIDGTLVLTGGTGRRALDALFLERYGVRDAFACIDPHGRTDRSIVREMIEHNLARAAHADEIDDVLDAYLPRLAFELEAAPGYRVLPGAAALVAELAARDDVVLGLATGNVERAARLKLARAGLADYFPFGGFGCDDEDRAALTRAAVQRGRARATADAAAFVIGDTVLDVRAARAADARCLAVLTSGADPDALVREGAAAVVPTLDDREAVLRALGLDP